MRAFAVMGLDVSEGDSGRGVCWTGRGEGRG